MRRFCRHVPPSEEGHLSKYLAVETYIKFNLKLFDIK